jgi:hypothetical protein
MFSCFISFDESVYVTSDLDQKSYLIRAGKTQGKAKEYLQDSANALSVINTRIEKLISHLDDQYSGDRERSYFIKKLKQNYKSSILSEAAIDKRYTTFTVDKQDIHICLRTRDQKEQLYDINLLMYVVLHELAHLCNYDAGGNAIIGHGIEFISIFRFLVLESIKIGVYSYTDYSSTPKEYCGILVNTTIV